MPPEVPLACPEALPSPPPSPGQEEQAAAAVSVPPEAGSPEAFIEHHLGST